MKRIVEERLTRGRMRTTTAIMRHPVSRKPFLLPLILLLLAQAWPLPAASPPRGKERLRELAVMPTVQFAFGLQYTSASLAALTAIEPGLDASRLREELKSNPDDPKRMLELAKLIKGERESEARGLLRRAEVLLRRRSDQQPQNGIAMVDLAEALSGLGRHEESLSLCRRAIQVSPEEWKCWTELGQRLTGAVFGLWDPAHLPRSSWTSPEALQTALSQYRPPADALPTAESSMKEASECFDRAVQLAPDEAQVYLARANHQTFSIVLEAIGASLRNSEELDSVKIVTAGFSEPVLRDIRKAAALRPRNYQLIALIAWAEVISASAGRESAAPAIGAVPERALPAILECIGQLRRLGEDGDRKLAAASLEAAAMLEYVLSGELAPLKPALRQIVAMDPSRDQAWEMLAASVLQEPDAAARLVVLCEERLKTRDTTRTRLFLARALARDNKLDRAAETAREVIAREPGNVVAHMMVAGIGIRQGTNDNELLAGASRLEQARILIQKLPENEERAKRMREFTLNAALLCGLMDRPELGRDMVRSFLRTAPDDSVAKDILSALQ